MAQVIVELSGDERKILEAYKKARDADKALRESTGQTAIAGVKAANDYATGWTKAGKESAKSVDSLLSELRKAGPEGQEAAKLVSTKMQQAGRDSAKSFQSVIDYLKATDPAAADAARKIRYEMQQAAKDSQFKETLESLRNLGPEGKAMAEGIARDMKQSSASSVGSLDSIVDKLADINPAARAAAQRIKVEMQDADRKSTLRETISSMRDLGGESAEVASRIEKELKTAAVEAAGGMDALVAKLRELDPASAAAAERFKVELAEAAKFSEGKFEATLKKLRSMGPVGKATADDLKKHLVNAGQLSEESIEDVIKAIRKIDPAAAKAAEALHKKAKDAADKSETAFGKFGESAKAQILGVAGAYVGIQQAIQLVIDLNRKVIETNREAFESVKRQGEGDRKLLQVAGDDPKDFEALRTRADDLSMKYGISREESRNLVASARREGFEGSLDSIAANSQVIDVGVQTEVASKIPAIFKKEGITGEQAINATLTAANRSSVSTEELARAIPVASEGASMAGATASETLAVTAGISDQFNTPQTSADRIKALAMKISLDTGDQGKTAEEMEKLEKAESDRLDRAQKSFRTLQERASDIKSQIADTKKQPQTDATEKRLATLQTRLERAERDVSEFDQKDLVKKEIKNDPIRESLKGQGIIGPVRKMMAMTDEQRKSILGDDAESNTAFSLVAKNIEKIDAMQAEIEKQKQLTGTDQSAIAIKQAQANADPKLAATMEVAKSEIKLEVERENKRAITEGDRQTRKNDSLRSAEASGASPLRIAAAEMAGETIQGFGGDAGAAIPALVGDSLANFQRDLSQASVEDPQIQKALLAANQLQRRRTEDPNAILSVDETATYLSTPDKMVLPSEVTAGQQEKLTAAIVEQANQSQGLGRSVFTSLFNSVGLKNSDAGFAGFQASSEIAQRMQETDQPLAPLLPDEILTPSAKPSRLGVVAADEEARRLNEAGAFKSTVGSKDAAEQLAEQNRLMVKNNELLERQLKLAEQQSQASTETATNTKPRPPRITGGAEIASSARKAK